MDDVCYAFSHPMRSLNPLSIFTNGLSAAAGHQSSWRGLILTYSHTSRSIGEVPTTNNMNQTTRARTK